MTVSITARRVQGAVALFIATALLLRFGLTTFGSSGDPDHPGLLVRWLRYFSYFTIQSNIACLLAALMVARGALLETPWQRALRLASLVGITVTCIIYITILAGDSHETGWSQVANLMLHYIGPPLAVLSWLAVGPDVGLGFGDIPRAMIWPILWTAYTLIHGAISGWYPYGFIDVTVHGYGKVLVTVLLIFCFAVALAAAYAAISKLRWRGGAAPEVSPR